MRQFTVNKIKHMVYDSLDEAPADLEVQHDWKLGRINDWVLADDGAVIQVLRHGSMTKSMGKKKTVYYIGTCTGTFLISNKASMDTSKRDNIYSLGGDITRDDRVRLRSKLTGHELLFVRYIASGMPMQDAYVKSFPTNNKRYAHVRAGNLIKTERVQTAMKEELKPILEDLGINETYILRGIKDTAEESDKEDVKLRALFKLSDIMDLEDKNQTKVTQITGALFQGFTTDKLEAVERPKEIED